jgi:Flp pilus assembly pilin Flp
MKKRGQSAIEYMVLLAVVAAVVLIGLRTWLGTINETSGNYFNEVSEGIMDAPPPDLN